MLLGIDVNDTASYEVVSFYFNSVTNKVKNYCHREDIPEALETIIVQMVVDEYKKAKNNNVASIKRGDVSVSFNQKSFETDVFERYKKQLYPFRKLKTL